MAQCIRCSKELTADEMGLHRKLINRGATEFMCIDCLARYFNCDVSLLREKIEQFRAQGCLLFAKK